MRCSLHEPYLRAVALLPYSRILAWYPTLSHFLYPILFHRGSKQFRFSFFVDFFFDISNFDFMSIVGALKATLTQLC